MRAVRLLVLALSLAVLPVPGAAAQAPAAPPTGSADTGVITVGPPVEEASPAPAAGSAQFQGPPRTLRGYWHLFVAFAVAWLLLFGYTVSLVRRFARVERELAARS